MFCLMKMGNQHSSASALINVPKYAFSFPLFNDDNLMNHQKDVNAIHAMVSSAVHWMGGGTTFYPGRELFSVLITKSLCFLLNQLERKPKENNNETHFSLQEALLLSKVDHAITNASTSELQAKICALKNRYNRLLSEIPTNDKLFEIVPAVQTCEEVLDLFRNRNHVFWKNCLITSPFFVNFASLYLTTAELSIVLIPSYTDHLVQQVQLLKDTLIDYRQKCIEVRLASVSIQREIGNSILESAVMTSTEYSIVDKSMKHKLGDGDCTRQHGNVEDVLWHYRGELTVQYNLFFQPILTAAEKFSGFNEQTKSEHK